MLAIVTTLAINLLVSGATDAARSNAVAMEGWQLLQKQELSSALDKFQEAVKLDPNNGNAWNGLGWVYMNSGSGDQAQNAWQKCLKLIPNQPAALNGLGQLALMRRQYDQAEKYLLASAASPKAPAALFGLTRLYLLQGKYEQAEKWGQKLVAVEPNNETSKQMLAAAKARELDPPLRDQLEPPPADESATKESPASKPAAVAPGGKVDVGRSNAIAAEAWQSWQQQKPAEALEKFQKAVELNPNNANAWNGLGWVYFGSGTNDEAQDAWQKCLAIMPNNAAALNGLGQLALNQRQYDKAEKYLLKAANQQAQAAWFGLARLYLLQGKYEQAQMWAQKLVTGDPHNTDAARMLSAAKARQLAPDLRNLLEPPPAETPQTQPAS